MSAFFLSFPSFLLSVFSIATFHSLTNLFFSFFTSSFRLVQLLTRVTALQARVQLLPNSNLHSLLHVGHRQLGLLLARPECHTGPSVTGRDNAAHHGYLHLRHQLLSAAGQLHQGHWRVDGRLSDLRLWGSTWVCPGQLRLSQRRPPSSAEAAAGGFCGPAQVGPGAARRCHGGWSHRRAWICIRNGKCVRSAPSR